ncbi:MAG: ATP-binding protein [Bacteroidota bacterium]
METFKSLKSTIKLLREELALEKSRNIVNTSVLEGSNLIVWSVNMDFELISFNQNYFRELFSDEKNSKITFYEGDVIKTQKARTFWKNRYQQAAKGNLLNFELQVTNQPGNIWKGVFLNPTYDNSGNIIAVSGVAYDITEKMQSRIDLQKSERKFRTIFESFQDLYFRCTLDGIITMLSPSVKAITGFESTELIGKNITNFYIYNQRTKSLLKQLAQNGKVQNLEFDLVHKSGGKIPCNCNLNLVYDELQPRYIEGVARDITLLKKANLELKESKEELEKSLKIKERFLANMSHEIRTPLNGIMGMVHLLSETKINDQQTKHINSLRSSADILLDLLNDLLDISKIEAGKMALNRKNISLHDLMNKLKHLYSAQALDNQVDLAFTIEEGVPDFITTDEVKLLQIFSNLLSNGIKFTQIGGRVTTSISVKKVNNKVFWLKGSVSDNGIGISQKDQKRLFKSFSQLDSSKKKSYGGTGLGLHLSKNLVKLFGGQIQVESEKGQGSIFWFTFKTKQSKSKNNKSPKSSPGRLNTSTKILVVDDNSINLQLASEILSKAGAVVETAKSGFEALRLCSKANFDVVIMDIQMPGMNGIITATKLHEQLDSLPPIIAMTAYGKAESFDKSVFQDYIAKPIDPVNLIHKVENCCLGGFKKTQSSIIENTSKKEVMNKKVLSKLASYGGEEMVLEALGEFCQELDHQIEELDLLLRSEEYQEASNVLHTIKGNAGTLGADRIARWSEHMESVTKTKKYHTFDADLEKLRLLFASFQKEVQSFKV